MRKRSPSLTKVLFVCGRNQRRSPTAERIFRDDPRMSVRSAGEPVERYKAVRGSILRKTDSRPVRGRTLQMADRNAGEAKNQMKPLLQFANHVPMGPSLGYLPDTETEIERVDSAIWAEESREDREDDDRFEDIQLLTPAPTEEALRLDSRKTHSCTGPVRFSRGCVGPRHSGCTGGW